MSRAQPCHVYTFPLRTYGTVPKYPDTVPKQTVLAAAGIRRIPLSPDPALLPSPPLLGVSRVTAVQIYPTISCSVRDGSARQTVPRNRPPRCGFTQQSKRDRSATWWPGDIHNRPSVRNQGADRVHPSLRVSGPRGTKQGLRAKSPPGPKILAVQQPKLSQEYQNVFRGPPEKRVWTIRAL